MNGSQSNGPVTAKELMDRLNDDPEYQARIQEIERQRLARIAEHMREAQPIIDELKAAGFDYDSLDDLRESGTRYVEAIPTLVKWLPLVQNRSVREGIVRALMVPWSRPTAVQPLIQAFKVEPPSDWTGGKWLLATALEIIADDSMFEAIAELAQDVSHGTSRKVLAQALAKMKNPRAADILIDLLYDKDVEGAALQALRKMAPEKARSHFEHFLNDPRPGLRKEAKKGLEKLDKKAARKK